MIAVWCGIATLVAWGVVGYDFSFWRSWILLSWFIPAVALAQIAFGIAWEVVK